MTKVPRRRLEACSACGFVRNVNTYQVGTLCNACAKKERGSIWGNHYRKCIDCGKEGIVRGPNASGRCKRCNIVSQTKRNYGPDHHNWKGGIEQPRPEEHNRWSRKVRTRDDYTCQKCGTKTGRMHAHHIFSYKEFPERRYELDNGITLCHPCHSQVHAIKKCGFIKGPPIFWKCAICGEEKDILIQNREHFESNPQEPRVLSKSCHQ